MPTAARHGSYRSPRPALRTWAAIAAAVIVHVLMLGTVKALDLIVVGQGMSTREGHPPAAPPELATGCKGDSMLAGAARMTMCFAPWHADTDQCLQQAQLEMFMDLSSCVGQKDSGPVAAISVVDPKTAEKLTPIDPEPLIEQMKQQEQQKPPELAQQQPQQQQPPPPPPAQARNAQIVETAKPTAEKPPDNARFLSEFDTAVQKQTVARGAVKEPMTAKSKPEELAAKENPREASMKEQQDRPRSTNQQAPDVPGTLSMRSPGVQTPSTTQQDQKTRGATTGVGGPLAFDGYMPKKGDGAFDQQRKERSEIPRGQTGAGGGAPDLLKLKPSQEVLERALGGGSVDHLDDVASGDETALNAKRWVHASFFNRLKRQVAQNWDPASVWRRRDPNGQVYGYKTRITEVRVALTAKGELAKIVVVSPSGVSELDDEAMRAFKAAAPFPNPPKELASDDGLITFAFSFYFEIGAPRSSWRVVRSM